MWLADVHNTFNDVIIFSVLIFISSQHQVLPQPEHRQKRHVKIQRGRRQSVQWSLRHSLRYNIIATDGGVAIPQKRHCVGCKCSLAFHTIGMHNTYEGFILQKTYTVVT